jgi:hypothetical protein
VFRRLYQFFFGSNNTNISHPSNVLASETVEMKALPLLESTHREALRSPRMTTGYDLAVQIGMIAASKDNLLTRFTQVSPGLEADCQRISAKYTNFMDYETQIGTGSTAFSSQATRPIVALMCEQIDAIKQLFASRPKAIQELLHTIVGKKRSGEPYTLETYQQDLLPKLKMAIQRAHSHLKDQWSEIETALLVLKAMEACGRDTNAQLRLVSFQAGNNAKKSVDEATLDEKRPGAKFCTLEYNAGHLTQAFMLTYQEKAKSGKTSHPGMAYLDFATGEINVRGSLFLSDRLLPISEYMGLTSHIIAAELPALGKNLYLTAKREFDQYLPAAMRKVAL